LYICSEAFRTFPCRYYYAHFSLHLIQKQLQHYQRHTKQINLHKKMCRGDSEAHYDGELDLAAELEDLAAGALCDAGPKEDELRLKNSQLHEVEVRILSVPRAERKQLQAEAAALESEIKLLQAEFGSPFERCLANLRSAFKSDELPSIVESLHYLFVAMENVHDVSCLEGANDLLLELASAMQSHPGEEALAREALLVLHLLARDPEAANELMATGLGKEAVEAVNRHVSDPDVAMHGLHALSNLFMSVQNLENGDAVAQQLVELNAGETAVAAMAEHLEVEEVQLYGCLIINNLAVYKTMWTTEQTASLDIWCTTARVAAGKARRRHAQHLELTKWADAAIRIL